MKTLLDAKWFFTETHGYKLWGVSTCSNGRWKPNGDVGSKSVRVGLNKPKIAFPTPGDRPQNRKIRFRGPGFEAEKKHQAACSVSSAAHAPDDVRTSSLVIGASSTEVAAPAGEDIPRLSCQIAWSASPCLQAT